MKIPPKEASPQVTIAEMQRRLRAIEEGAPTYTQAEMLDYVEQVHREAKANYSARSIQNKGSS